MLLEERSVSWLSMINFLSYINLPLSLRDNISVALINVWIFKAWLDTFSSWIRYDILIIIIRLIISDQKISIGIFLYLNIREEVWPCHHVTNFLLLLRLNDLNNRFCRLAILHDILTVLRCSGILISTKN